MTSISNANLVEGRKSKVKGRDVLICSGAFEERLGLVAVATCAVLATLRCAVVLAVAALDVSGCSGAFEERLGRYDVFLCFLVKLALHAMGIHNPSPVWAQPLSRFAQFGFAVVLAVAALDVQSRSDIFEGCLGRCGS